MTNDISKGLGSKLEFPTIFGAVLVVLNLIFTACATAPDTLYLKDVSKKLEAGVIIASDTDQIIAFEEFIQKLEKEKVIYVGERHTNAHHHQAQLQILKAIYNHDRFVAVGMEMFDHTYQHILDQWSFGDLDEQTFIEKTHWYANWRYDFALYRDILLFIKENRIKLIGLNIPFHIPAKIRVGGVDNLSASDRHFLPAKIDTTNSDHRAYVEKIFQQHHFRKKVNFDYFYQAQCAWEDGMAAAIGNHGDTGKIVVMIGKGHIVNKFGVPERAFKINPQPYSTVFLASVGSEAKLSYADFLWATPPPNKKKQ